MSLKEINILWISDIHYKEEFSNIDDVNIYTEYFIEFLDKEEISNDITHLVISGDISSTGTSLDYESFEKDFYQKLIQALPKNTIQLVIPGNHDVDWIYLKDTIKSIDELKYDHKKPIKDDINEAFKNYRAKFNGLISEHHKTLDKQDFEFKYDYDRLVGYFYDIKHNYLFLLINSALNSFGNIRKESISDFMQKDQALYDDVLKLVESHLSEYGNQTYGLQILFANRGPNKKFHDGIKSILATKNPPFVISIAHHPPDWIHYSEKFSNTSGGKSLLDKLFNISQLLLVGHEHSSPSIGVEYGSCLLLRGGLFLNNDVLIDNVYYENDLSSLFPNNWFSVLKLNSDKIVEKRFFYDTHDDLNQWVQKDPIEYPNSTISTPIDTHKSNHINFKTVDVNCSSFRFLDYLREKRGITGLKEISQPINWPSGFKYRIYKSIDTRANQVPITRLLIMKPSSIFSVIDGELIADSNFLSLLTSKIAKGLKKLDRANNNEQSIIVSFFEFYEMEIPKINSLGSDETRFCVSKKHQMKDLEFTIIKQLFFEKLRNEYHPMYETLCEMILTFDYIHFTKVQEFIDKEDC